MNDNERRPYPPDLARIRWFLIFGIIFALTLTTTYVVSQVDAAKYHAMAVIQIRQVRSMGGIEGGDLNPYSPAAVQQAVQTLNSPEFLLGLAREMGFDKVWAKRLTDSDQPLSDAEAMDCITWRLKIAVKPRTNFVEIKTSSEVPQEAADIANGVADHYKKLRDTEEYERTKGMSNSLREQIVRQQKVVADKKVAMSRQLPNLSPAYQAALHDLTEQESLLTALLTRERQNMVQGSVLESPVRIISRAEVPPHPSQPSPVLDFLVMVLEALVLGAGVATLVEVGIGFYRKAKAGTT